MTPRPADPRALAWLAPAALLVLVAALTVLALQRWLVHVETQEWARASRCERCQHLARPE